MFRYALTTQKASGVLSGVQNVADGPIEWSTQLPTSCRLSEWVSVKYCSYVSFTFCESIYSSTLLDWNLICRLELHLIGRHGMVQGHWLNTCVSSTNCRIHEAQTWNYLCYEECFHVSIINLPYKLYHLSVQTAKWSSSTSVAYRFNWILECTFHAIRKLKMWALCKSFALIRCIDQLQTHSLLQVS